MSRLRARVLAVCGGTALLTVVALASVSTAPACAERVCEFSGKDYGRGQGEGQLVAPGLWQTTPQYGKWLPFPAQRSWYIFPQQLARTDFARVLVYISASEEPNPGVQYTLASGDSALQRQFPDPGDPTGQSQGVQIHNNTCADFFVRVVIEAYPPGFGTPNADAGDDGGDGGAPDGDASGPVGDAASDSSDSVNDASDGAPE